MKVEVGDIEVLKSFFCLCITDFHTKEKVASFRISYQKNEIDELYQYIIENKKNKDYYIISFNGNNYDWIIINYIVVNYYTLRKLSSKAIINRVYLVSQSVLESQNNNNFHYSEYKRYSYNLPFSNSIDLFQFWSKLTIRSRKLSLKFFAVSLDLSVVECSIPWDKEDITEEEGNTIIEYCFNDTDITLALAYHLRDKINFRLNLRRTMGFDCLSWSEVKIGLESLIKDISVKNNVSEKNIRDMRTYRTSVKLSDIILPNIIFETPATGNHWKVKAKSSKKGENKFIDCFNTFTDLLNHLKTVTVYNTKSINCRVFFKDTIYDVKSGGLHSYHDSEIRVKEKGKLYKDIDV